MCSANTSLKRVINVSKINDIRLKKDILLFFEDMKEEVFSECKIDRKILF